MSEDKTDDDLTPTPEQQEMLKALGVDVDEAIKRAKLQREAGLRPFRKADIQKREQLIADSIISVLDEIEQSGREVRAGAYPAAIEGFGNAISGMVAIKSMLERIVHESVSIALSRVITNWTSGMILEPAAPPPAAVPLSKEGDGYL